MEESNIRENITNTIKRKQIENTSTQESNQLPENRTKLTQLNKKTKKTKIEQNSSNLSINSIKDARQNISTLSKALKK